MVAGVWEYRGLRGELAAAQARLVDLADGVAGQLVEEHDVARHLETGEVCLDVLAEVVLAHLAGAHQLVEVEVSLPFFFKLVLSCITVPQWNEVSQPLPSSVPPSSKMHRLLMLLASPLQFREHHQSFRTSDIDPLQKASPSPITKRRVHCIRRWAMMADPFCNLFVFGLEHHDGNITQIFLYFLMKMLSHFEIVS